MSEINNNDMLKRFNAVSKSALPKAEEVKSKAEKPQETQEENSVKDFGNIPAETIGRSQVSKADNMVNDMKIMRENPKLVSLAGRYFDFMLEKNMAAGVDDAYAKACVDTDLFVKELMKK